MLESVFACYLSHQEEKNNDRGERGIKKYLKEIGQFFVSFGPLEVSLFIRMF